MSDQLERLSESADKVILKQKNIINKRATSGRNGRRKEISNRFSPITSIVVQR
jgi:hypothetical protein